MGLEKLISGGQTGVDLGALRAAHAAGLKTGGWCPPDCRNEAGPIPPGFGLQATREERSSRALTVPRSLRTEWNVRDADATLLLLPTTAELADPGTAWTQRCAEIYARPLLQVAPAAHDAAATVREWLRRGGFRTLNVAGPSEASSPGIEARTLELLSHVFGTD